MKTAPKETKPEPTPLARVREAAARRTVEQLVRRRRIAYRSVR